MRIAVSKQPVTDAQIKTIAGIFTVLILAITGLTLLSRFSDVRTTVHYTPAWSVAYAAVLGCLLISLAISLKAQKAKFHIQGGKLKLLGLLLLGLFGLAVLTHGAVFSGFPVVLHHLTSEHGELEVTVAGKEDSYSRRRCEPRLIIAEFTYWISDFICPGEEAFSRISIGDKIKLVGSLSPYGIEPKQIQWRE